MKILYNNRSAVNHARAVLKYNNTIIKIYIHNLRDLIIRDYIDECYIVSARDCSVYSEMTYKNSKYFHLLEDMEKI